MPREDCDSDRCEERTPKRQLESRDRRPLNKQTAAAPQNRSRDHEHQGRSFLIRHWLSADYADYTDSIQNTIHATAVNSRDLCFALLLGSCLNLCNLRNLRIVVKE